jgi:RecB family exonuclease
LQSGDTLFGIIDRLYRDANDIWTVLDYKTETPSNPERKRKNLDRYKFQLLFYSYLVHLMDSNAVSIRAVIFYTATGETAEFIFDSNDFANFEIECSAIIEQIRMNENISDLRLLNRNTAHCPECSFFNIEKNCCTVLAASI